MRPDYYKKVISPSLTLFPFDSRYMPLPIADLLPEKHFHRGFHSVSLTTYPRRKDFATFFGSRTSLLKAVHYSLESHVVGSSVHITHARQRTASYSNIPVSRISFSGAVAYKTGITTWSAPRYVGAYQVYKGVRYGRYLILSVPRQLCIGLL